MNGVRESDVIEKKYGDIKEQVGEWMRQKDFSWQRIMGGYRIFVSCFERLAQLLPSSPPGPGSSFEAYIPHSPPPWSFSFLHSSSSVPHLLADKPFLMSPLSPESGPGLEWVCLGLAASV